jgi:membrane associated rhomboid family serine protease
MFSFLDTLQHQLMALVSHMPQILCLLAVLWLILLLNKLSGNRLNQFGIRPRSLRGLIGIPLAPFLHQDAKHLLANSLPLFILLCFMTLLGWQFTLNVTVIIILGSGLGIWLFGRSGVHVGASALVMGYFGFIISFAFRSHKALPIAIAVVMMIYLGGLFQSLFPRRDNSSWEGHLIGFMLGVWLG